MNPATMRSRVRAYLAHRRKLGFILDTQERHLRGFSSFADRRAPGQPLTTALALQWATSIGNNRFGYQAMRYQAVRNLAHFLSALDPRTQVPPSRLLGSTMIRRQPHIYTPKEVRLMMRQSRQIPHRYHYAALRPLTFETIIGLMFCTGLRRAEAIRLRLADFDAKTRTILVRQTKSSPPRILPLHPTVVTALQRYQQARQRIVPFGDHFFVCQRGRPFWPSLITQYFSQVARGVVPNGARSRVRLTDLRHTFATRRIAAWSRRATPVPHYLMLLSRYMGHKHFNATWWYVSPDLSALKGAAQLFQQFQQDKSSNPL
jgi:integrase